MLSAADNARSNGRRPMLANSAIEVTADAEQVLFGSVLGDAHLAHPPRATNSVNWRVEIKHGLAQAGYLTWKAALLGPLVRRVDAPPARARLRTVSHPYVTKLAACVVRDGVRRVPRGLLDQFGPLAFAVWFLDDGTIDVPVARAGRSDDVLIRLCTSGFPEDDTRFLAAYVAARFAIRTTIATWRNPRNAQRPYLGVRLYGDNARHFRSYFEHITPPTCLAYKWRDASDPRKAVSS